MSTSTLQTLCCITLFTYFGALTRMILSSLSALSKAQFLPDYVASFFLANIHGSFVMGLFVPLDQFFSPNCFAWYTGVTTGYCGSCTTFSTWQRITAEQLVNGRFVDGLMTSLLTFCSSYMALIFGKNIGEEVCKRYVRCDGTATSTNTSTNRVRSTDSCYTKLRHAFGLHKFLLTVTILVTLVIWTAVALDTDTESRRKWWVATAFGPVGSLTRYWLLLYNRNRPTFPFFTFLVNVTASGIGTAIWTVYLLSSNKYQSAEWLSMYDFWLNFGAGAGILGCFSTVSTFVNELRKLADKNILHAYRYGLLSVFISQILCILIYCTKFL